MVLRYLFLGRQSSFFNFYYCRWRGYWLCDSRVNPLSLISTIVDTTCLKRKSLCQSSFFNFYYCRSRVRNLPCQVVNPLSLISTIVDTDLCRHSPVSQSSFFNFYYCRSEPTFPPSGKSILFL